MNTFCTFASGSKGNAALYTSDHACILIDAGTTTKYIASSLGQLGLTLKDLTHILITHGHNDHVAALPILCKHTRAKLVCSEDAYYTLNATGWEAEVFRPGEAFDLLDVPVLSFATPHDAMGSCGYILGEGGCSVAYCTDLGDMLPPILEAMTGCHTLLLESNHDVHMLKNGSYPYSLKKRVLSGHGHLANDLCAQTAVHLAHHGTQRVLLAHLSEENNTPHLAYRTSCDALAAAGMEEDVELAVVPVRAVMRYRL